MIVSDTKRIIETSDNYNLNDAIIGYCDTVGGFINYIDTKTLNSLKVVREYTPIPDEKWYEWN